jgi:hypothetical protein
MGCLDKQQGTHTGCKAQYCCKKKRFVRLAHLTKIGAAGVLCLSSIFLYIYILNRRHYENT